jgi:hypothetical protein
MEINSVFPQTRGQPKKIEGKAGKNHLHGKIQRPPGRVSTRIAPRSHGPLRALSTDFRPY